MAVRLAGLPASAFRGITILRQDMGRQVAAPAINGAAPSGAAYWTLYWTQVWVWLRAITAPWCVTYPTPAVLRQAVQLQA